MVRVPPGGQVLCITASTDARIDLDRRKRDVPTTTLTAGCFHILHQGEELTRNLIGGLYTPEASKPAHQAQTLHAAVWDRLGGQQASETLEFVLPILLPRGNLIQLAQYLRAAEPCRQHPAVAELNRFPRMGAGLGDPPNSEESRRQPERCVGDDPWQHPAARLGQHALKPDLRFAKTSQWPITPGGVHRCPQGRIT